MKKNWLILSFIFTMLFVSACSSNNTSNESKSTNTGPTEDKFEAVDAAKPYVGQELTVIYMSGTYTDAAKLIAGEFEEKTGAKVIIQDAPYLQLFEKEFSSLVSGSDYDVLSIAVQWDGQFAPYLEPWPDDSDSDFDKFIPSILRITSNYNDIRTGVPMATDVYGVYYRTDLFEKSGIKVDPKTWTWEEYEDIAAKLHKDGIAGTSIPGQVDQMGVLVYSRYWSKGGHLFTKDWTPLPQKELMVEAIEDLIRLKQYMPEGIASYDLPTQTNGFVEGKIAMGEVWPSFSRVAAKDSSYSKVVETWNELPLPGGAHSVISAWGLAIPKASKNKELAREWIKLYTSEEKQRLFLKKIGVGPTISALYEDPEIVKDNPEFPNHLTGLSSSFPLLNVPGGQEFQDFFDQSVQAAFIGTTTAQKVVDDTIKKWTELLDKNGKPEGEYTGDYN